MDITGARFGNTAPPSPRGFYGTPPGSPHADQEDHAVAEFLKQQKKYAQEYAEYEKQLMEWKQENPDGDGKSKI